MAISYTKEPLRVIPPGPKLGQAPMTGPYLIETVPGISVGTARNKGDAHLFAEAAVLCVLLKDALELFGRNCTDPDSWEVAARDTIARIEGQHGAA